MSQAEAQQSMAELDAIQRRMQALQRQLGSLEQTMMDTQQALASLESIRDGEADGPMLVTIGAGVHIQVRLEPGTPVLHPVGAETSVGSTVEETISWLEGRREEIRGIFEKGAAELQELANQGQKLQEAMSVSSE